MKKITFLVIPLLFVLGLRAQMPYIGTYTIIPQSPTPADFVKIVTKVTTPNLGVGVDLSHSVTGFHIKLNGCYAQGMATALQTYIDTFMIGQLPPGNYTITQKAYLSSAQQWCNKIDSNSITGSTQVSGFTGINEQALKKEFNLFPNPASEKLYISGIIAGNEIEVLSYSGVLLKKQKPGLNGELNIAELPDGLYLLKISGHPQAPVKFTKCGSQ